MKQKLIEYKKRKEEKQSQDHVGKEQRGEHGAHTPNKNIVSTTLKPTDSRKYALAYVAPGTTESVRMAGSLSKDAIEPKACVALRAEYQRHMQR